MAYGMEFLGGLGSNLSKFASSGLGQAAIGAGLGYGADKLTGGEGKTGALLGLGGGLLNYGSGGGFGGDFNFGDSALGQAQTGLFGQPTKPTTGSYDVVGSMVPDYMKAGSTATKVPETTTGLFDSLSNLHKKYGDSIGTGTDIAKAYGDISGGLAQQDLAQAEVDYRNRLAGLSEAQIADMDRRKRAMEAGATTGFEQSSLGNYYTA